MTIRTATIHNKYGIHCRPAALIAKEAQNYQGKIRIANGQGRAVEARNIMGLISLGINCGQSVTIEVEGPNEDMIADNIRELLEAEFDFPR